MFYFCWPQATIKCGRIEFPNGAVNDGSSLQLIGMLYNLSDSKSTRRELDLPTIYYRNGFDINVSNTI